MAECMNLMQLRSALARITEDTKPDEVFYIMVQCSTHIHSLGTTWEELRITEAELGRLYRLSQTKDLRNKLESAIDRHGQGQATEEDFLLFALALDELSAGIVIEDELGIARKDLESYVHQDLAKCVPDEDAPDEEAKEAIA